MEHPTAIRVKFFELDPTAVFVNKACKSVDGYKLGHISQYIKGTIQVGANMTPRDSKFANVIREQFDGKVVYMGLQYTTIKMVQDWNTTFFDLPEDEVIEDYARSVKNYLGPDHGDDQIDAMRKLHKLGYLPLHIKSLPEGVRVDMKVPVFTVKNTHPDFYWLTNYIETFLSQNVWPICNAASISDQYLSNTKKWAAKCEAPQEWIGIANHLFAARGHRGSEDAIMSAMAHATCSYGSDTFASIDALDFYYGADSDNNMVSVSVNAFEHATATQRIAYYRDVLGFNAYPLEAEKESLRDIVTNLYPTGIVSYVGDSDDYFGLLEDELPKLKAEILARTPDANGLCKFVTRPDSSPKTPLEVILGDCYIVKDGDTRYMRADSGKIIGREASAKGYQWVRFKNCFYVVGNQYQLIQTDHEDVPAEVKGTLQLLWDTFGGMTKVVAGGRELRLLNDKVGVIYGEAITVQMHAMIYELMERAGWCVSNILMGIGSWGVIGNSSRDSYGFALKGTNSVVLIDNREVEVSMQKNPKTASAFKKSAKGRLRVEKEEVIGGGESNYILYDNQTEEQEKWGELDTLLYNGEFFNLATLEDLRGHLLYK